MLKHVSAGRWTGLAHEREVRQLRRQRRPPVHSLLYQRVPVKLPNEWDREQLGNVRWTSYCTAGDPRPASICTRCRW